MSIPHIFAKIEQGRDAKCVRRFVETWQDASWLQHLRHHEHVSGSDRSVQEQLWQLNRASVPPSATHLISAL